MMDKVEIIGEWDDDLIWCPSQCYLKLKYMGINFTIYLRWRYKDPWTAELIQCNEEWNLHALKLEWIDLLHPTDYFRDIQLNELKAKAIKNAKKYLYSGTIDNF